MLGVAGGNLRPPALSDNPAVVPLYCYYKLNFPLLQTHLSHYYALKSNGGENLRYCEYKSDTNSDEYNYNLVMIIRLQFFRQS